MIVAFASFASVGGGANSRHPRQIVVKVLASLAIQTGRVVLAFAFTVNHVLTKDLLVVQWNASARKQIIPRGVIHCKIVNIYRRK